MLGDGPRNQALRELLRTELQSAVGIKFRFDLKVKN